MADSALSQIAIVLYEPQDPVNIAATVRAMKNMGLSDLRLVRPCEYTAYRLEGIAHGTMDLIERIRHFDTTDDAFADAVWIAAFTGRRRAHKWRMLEPRSLAVEALEHARDGTVCVVYGREDDGLPNEVVDRAHAVVTIPTTEHSSLNLAQAVLVACYELHLAAGDVTRPIARARKHAPPPPAALMERYFLEVERTLTAIEFFKARNTAHIMRAVRSLTFRSAPDARELSLLRAITIEVVRYLERKGHRLVDLPTPSLEDETLPASHETDISTGALPTHENS